MVLFGRNIRRGLHMIGKTSEKTPSPYFRVDENIPETGVYRVFHAEHRVSHHATLLRGEKFPRCAVCGDDVHFELITAAPQVEADEDFRSRKLFELSHPTEALAEKKSA
jgi:hypothetical protein